MYDPYVLIEVQANIGILINYCWDLIANFNQWNNKVISDIYLTQSYESFHEQFFHCNSNSIGTWI